MAAVQDVRLRPLYSVVASVGALAIALVATAISHPAEGVESTDSDDGKADEPAPEVGDWHLVDGREAAQGETQQAARSMLVRFFGST